MSGGIRPGVLGKPRPFQVLLNSIRPAHSSSGRINMKTKTPVRRVKRQDRSRQRPPAVARTPAGPNIWSKSVRCWVNDFQKRDHTEAQPKFDSLFKDSHSNELADSD